MAIEFGRKCCATCEYWSGSRKVNDFNNRALCQHSNDKGICGNSKCGNSKKSMNADHGSCTKYMKWALLPRL